MSRESPWPIDLGKLQAHSSRSRAEWVLHEIDGLVDWSQVDRLIEDLPVNRATRPRYPAKLLTKVLLLQAWYNLSDPAVEDAINDRRSFATFVELPPGAPCPSYSTVNRFKADLGKRGLLEPLFDVVNDQLAAHGYVVRTGVMVDAILSGLPPSPFGSGTA